MTAGYERIDASPKFDAVRPSHEWRYKWAAQFIEPTDTVLDAACGTGYGKDILGGALYYGVDRFDNGTNLIVDLETWRPNFDFDVFVCLETIEHIKNVQNILDIARKAKKYAIISTPIVPTVGHNEFHVNDFTAYDVRHFLPHLVAFEKQDSGDGTRKDMYGIAAFRI